MADAKDRSASPNRAPPTRIVSGRGGELAESDLGAGTPGNVDIHKLGQEDNPQEDWGDPAGEGMMHSGNHSRRGVKTEAVRGQGARTRRRTKDIFSRRG